MQAKITEVFVILGDIGLIKFAQVLCHETCNLARAQWVPLTRKSAGF